MEIKAEAKYIHKSPRKIALLAQVVRGLAASVALQRLAQIRKAASQPLIKVIKSAVSNAVANFKVKSEALKIKKIEVGVGPALKRWRPVARGTAHPYKKRTSHIRVILEETA